MTICQTSTIQAWQQTTETALPLQNNQPAQTPLLTGLPKRPQPLLPAGRLTHRTPAFSSPCIKRTQAGCWCKKAAPGDAQLSPPQSTRAYAAAYGEASCLCGAPSGGLLWITSHTQHDSFSSTYPCTLVPFPTPELSTVLRTEKKGNSQAMQGKDTKRKPKSKANPGTRTKRGSPKKPSKAKQTRLKS